MLSFLARLLQPMSAGYTQDPQFQQGITVMCHLPYHPTIHSSPWNILLTTTFPQRGHRPSELVKLLLAIKTMYMHTKFQIKCLKCSMHIFVIVSRMKDACVAFEG